MTGSVAAAIYGEPRLTQDVDLVLSLSTSDVSRLLAPFSEHEYYVPPREAMREEYFQAGGGEKHLRDICQMLRVTGAGIDRTLVLAWVERLGLGAAWQKALELDCG
ncbi:MAG: hypothetical protein ACT4P7_10780 [Gemmatimonadaceae bacterium]